MQVGSDGRHLLQFTLLDTLVLLGFFGLPAEGLGRELVKFVLIQLKRGRKYHRDGANLQLEECL